MCDCVIPDFYREERRKARKTYRCDECRETISPGDVYVSINGKWEGEFNSFRMCQLCKEAHKEYERESDCCVGFGYLEDELSQCGPASEWDAENTPAIVAWIKAKKPDWLAAT